MSARPSDVEHVGIIDLVSRREQTIHRERVRRLTGNRGERVLRRQTICLAELVVAADAVITRPLDVDGAQVGYSVEALRHGRPVEARWVARHGHLEQGAAQLVVDVLVVVVLRLGADRRQHLAQTECRQQVRVEERNA